MHPGSHQCIIPKYKTRDDTGLVLDVYVLSEVKLSSSAQRSVARGASCGFVALWSSAPAPPSGGFAVPPDGVGVLVSSRFLARKVEAPELHLWQSIGRIVAVRISFESCDVMVLAIHGSQNLMRCIVRMKSCMHR